MDILDILLDILLKPPQPLMGLFLSDESLTNWRAAQIYKHLQAANEFFHECRAFFVEREPLLATEMETLFVAGSEVYHKLRDRAKLGTTAASSVPIVLTGKKPTRSNVIGRWAKFPKNDCRLTGLQPSQNLTTQRTTQPYPTIFCMSRKKPGRKFKFRAHRLMIS